MYRLKSQFDPHRLDLIKLIQKGKNLISDAVRSCPDGQCYYGRMPDCLRKNLSKVYDRCIRIRVCLKISNIFVNRTFRTKHLDLAVNLIGYGKRRICCKIAASSGTAENTAPASQLTVPVRTGHAAIQSYFVDFFTKHLLKHIVQRMIRLAIPVSYTLPCSRCFTHTDSPALSCSSSSFGI